MREPLPVLTDIDANVLDKNKKSLFGCQTLNGCTLVVLEWFRSRAGGGGREISTLLGLLLRLGIRPSPPSLPSAESHEAKQQPSHEWEHMSESAQVREEAGNTEGTLWAAGWLVEGEGTPRDRRFSPSNAPWKRGSQTMGKEEKKQAS